MNKRINALLFSFACLISGCVEEETNLLNVQIEECYINDKVNKLIQTDDFSVQKVVELRMPEQLDIVSCEKMYFSNGRWYFLDKKSKKVFVFDENGNLLHSLGRIGHAIDELYRTLTDFAVDSCTKDLFMFEYETRKIIKFDSLGVFVSASYFSDIWPFAFEQQKSGEYVFAFRIKEDRQSSAHELAFYDKNKEKKIGYFPFKETQAFAPNEMPFGRYYDKIAYIPNYSETVYFLDEDSISNGIHFSFESPYFRKQDIEKIKFHGDFEPITRNEERIHNLVYFYENEYWRRVDYSKGYRMQYLLNKKTNVFYNGSQLVNALFPDYVFTIVDDNLVFLVTTGTIELLKDLQDRMSSKEREKECNSTCTEVQQILDGELKAPCLIYVSFP